MSKGGCPSTNFILHELDDSLAAQLRQALSGPGQVLHSTSCTSECLAVVEQLGADIVFCDADPGKYQRLLGALERSGIKAPVVVVSRIPETSEWLDALDAGAADYCAAPFEHQHISWLIESALAATRRGGLPQPSCVR